MASRPVFVASEDGHVLETRVDFEWHPGMSVSQKRKSIESLHTEAAAVGIGPILEVSTKSDSAVGQSLSALRLSISLSDMGRIAVECAFQGSKVFSNGGPYTELYSARSVDAKRDPRLRESGPLTGFCLNGEAWPLEPKTVFYDWLYLSALTQNPALSGNLMQYTGFTDIEFNPKRSLNTQARSCALFVAFRARLVDVGVLLGDKHKFAKLLQEAYRCGPAGNDTPLLQGFVGG